MFSFPGHQAAYSPKKFPLGVTDKWDRNRILGLESEEKEIQWQHLDGMWFTTDDIMTKNGHRKKIAAPVSNCVMRQVVQK